MGTVEAEYTLQPKAYGPLISQRRDTESSFYAFDALGSTAALTDDTQAVTDSYFYKPFGEVRSSSGTTQNAFLWVGSQGYYHDDESDLYSIRKRSFGSNQGRWLSADPLGFRSGDSNFYRYVKNHPVNLVDPSGMQPPPQYNILPAGIDDGGAEGTDAEDCSEEEMERLEELLSDWLCSQSDDAAGVGAPPQSNGDGNDDSDLFCPAVVEMLRQRRNCLSGHHGPAPSPEVDWDRLIESCQQIADEADTSFANSEEVTCLLEAFADEYPNLASTLTQLLAEGYSVTCRDVADSIMSGTIHPPCSVISSSKHLCVDTHFSFAGTEYLAPTEYRLASLRNCVCEAIAIESGGAIRPEDLARVAEQIPICPELIEAWTVWYKKANEMFPRGKLCYDYADAFAVCNEVPPLRAAGYAVSTGDCYLGHVGIYVWVRGDPSRWCVLHVGSGSAPRVHTPWGRGWPIKVSCPGDSLTGLAPGIGEASWWYTGFRTVTCTVLRSYTVNPPGTACRNFDILEPEQ